jgi:hypothetical protein
MLRAGALVVLGILWAAGTAVSILDAESGRYVPNVVLAAASGFGGSVCLILGAVRRHAPLLTIGALCFIPWLAFEAALGSN